MLPNGYYAMEKKIRSLSGFVARNSAYGINTGDQIIDINGIHTLILLLCKMDVRFKNQFV